MRIYKGFADFYTVGDYSEFSKRMAKMLSEILEYLDYQPENILDIACGDGTFAVDVAGQGYSVAGIDKSPEMIDIARDKAHKAGVSVDFYNYDMRDFSLDREFDLITCWFDSVNYILQIEHLKKTFRCIYNALKDGGLFIFDINTIHCLSVYIQEKKTYIRQNTKDIFEVHSVDYDIEKNLATFSITGFKTSGEHYIRMDEVHKERGYTLKEIKDCLENSGFAEIARWGELEDFSYPVEDSLKVWFVAKK
jgi:SAM-dependent methyltransferase